MASYSKKAKSLLIFDLDGLLCHYTRNFSRKTNVTGVYMKGDLEAKPIYHCDDTKRAIYARPNLAKINYDILIKQKKLYDVGIWSSSNIEDTELMVKHVFGRFYTQLLFILYNKESTADDLSYRTSDSFEGHPRNFSSIW